MSSSAQERERARRLDSEAARLARSHLLPEPSRSGKPSVRARLSAFLRSDEEQEGMIEAAPDLPLRTIFRRFWPMTKGYRGRLAVTTALVMSVPLLTAAEIWLFKVAVDEVFVPADTSALAWVAGGFFALTLVGCVASFAERYMSDWVAERFLLDLRERTFAHVTSLSLDFFDRRRLGDTLSRLSGDIAAIERLMLSGVADGLSYILSIVVFTGALFVLDWRLALISLVFAPPFLLAARHFSREIKQSSREARRHNGALNSVAEESLGNMALVQAYGREPTEAKRYRRESDRVFQAQMSSTRLSATFSPVIDFMQGTGALAIIGFGTFALSSGDLTVGALLAFLAYLTQLFSPLRRMARLVNTLHSASAGAERVIELLDERPRVREPESPASLGTPRGEVELKGVSFTYPGSSRPALQGVSFTAAPGQTVALVGASGAGKSTISKLLLRFYDPEAGSIRLDGHDLKTLSTKDLRGASTLLLQETLIFHGTVRENIAYGLEGATAAQIERAAKRADAHEFISAMPDGYETVVGQRGRRLSGGQRQRIAIARAMLRDTPLVIFDEPTTSLDAESRDRVLRPMRDLMADRTTIVISHDLLTTADADNVIVLDGGRVAETGTHHELLARDGVYASLWRSHSRAPVGVEEVAARPEGALTPA